MKQSIQVTVLASCICSTSAMAIVDVESLRLDESIEGFSGSLTASASGKSGNTESNTYDIGTGLQSVNDTQVNLLLLSAEYSEVSGVETDKQFFVHARHTNKLDASWAWEVFAQYESQPLNNEFSRALLGSGARYAYGHNKYKGTTGVGVMAENQSVEVNDVQEDESFVRLNLYAKGNYAFNEKSKMGIGLYFQPEVTDFSNRTSIGSLAYTNKINERLSTTFDLSYQHVSKPAEGLEKTDTQYKFGINYRLGNL